MMIVLNVSRCLSPRHDQLDSIRRRNPNAGEHLKSAIRKTCCIFKHSTLSHSKVYIVFLATFKQPRVPPIIFLLSLRSSKVSPDLPILPETAYLISSIVHNCTRPLQVHSVYHIVHSVHSIHTVHTVPGGDVWGRHVYGGESRKLDHHRHYHSPWHECHHFLVSWLIGHYHYHFHCHPFLPSRFTYLSHDWLTENIRSEKRIFLLWKFRKWSRLEEKLIEMIDC